MEKNEEVESIIKKISDEIQSVKSHVSEAKYALNVDNYNNALKHLKEAENTSTCSYCKNKIQEAIFEIEYNRNICNINSKSCDSNKAQIIQKIDDFYNKLPSISEIRKNKAISSDNTNTDPLAEIWKSYDMMTQSVSKIFGGMFKF